MQPIWNHRVPRAPLPCMGVTQVRDDFKSHLGRHYSPFIAHTDSCVRPSPSCRLVFLVRRVFAGCHQSLLGNGPSRRYLRNPCIGAWTPTPWRSFGARTRFFPKDICLTVALSSSAHQTTTAWQLQRRG